MLVLVQQDSLYKRFNFHFANFTLLLKHMPKTVDIQLENLGQTPVLSRRHENHVSGKFHWNSSTK